MTDLIHKDDAPSIVPPIGVGSEGEILLDVEWPILIEDSKLR